MATKVQQKSDKITPFGGINFVMDKFDAYLGGEIDSFLGIRSTTIGYQYSEIILHCREVGQHLRFQHGITAQRVVGAASHCHGPVGIFINLNFRLLPKVDGCGNLTICYLRI